MSSLTPLLLTLTLTTPTALPDYSFQLQARANFSGAFNLPNSTFFTNSSPRVNGARQVCFDLEVVQGTTGQGVWWGQDGTGAVVYTSPAETFVLDTGLNAAGLVVFDQAMSSQDGLYRYDPETDLTTFATNLPLGASGWGSPRINDAGALGFRAGFANGQAFASWAPGEPSAAIHAADAGIDVNSPFSFLFTPAFNNQRQIAAKVRRGAAGQVGGSQPDEVRIFASNGSSVLIAVDRDGDPGSPYTSFDNAVSLTDAGWVAFVANLASGGRGVFLSNGTTTRTIATEAGAQISTIEFFAPAANDLGLVTFRAFDETNLRAVWVGDGTDLATVAREHDLVPTDLGSGRLDQHDASPVFGGSPGLNAFGDVVFSAGLTPPEDNQVEWGSGVFVARSNGLIFRDGFEGGSSGAWSSTTP